MSEQPADVDVAMQSEIFVVLAVVFSLLAAVALLSSDGRPEQITIYEATVQNITTQAFTLDHKLLRFESRDYEIPIDAAKKAYAWVERCAKVCGSDTLEVVGHADPIPVGSLKHPSIDTALNRYANREDHPPLEFHSNLVLGLARALSFVRYFESKREGTWLSKMNVRPYSAGSMVENGDRDRAGQVVEDPTRRRIELRLSWDGDPPNGVDAEEMRVACAENVES